MAEHSIYPLETAFFDICPIQFFDKVYNIIDDLIQQSVEELETNLLEEMDDADESEKQFVRSCCNKIQNKYQQAYDTNLDKLELYAIFNIFRVPPSLYKEWCRKNNANREVIELTDNSKSVTQSEVNEVTARVIDMRLKVRRERRLQLLLNAKLESLRSARQVLVAEIDKTCSIVESTKGTNGEAPLPKNFKTSLQQLMKQSKRLEGLMDDVHAAIKQVSEEGEKDEAGTMNQQATPLDHDVSASVASRSLKRTINTTTDDMRNLAARVAK